MTEQVHQQDRDYGNCIEAVMSLLQPFKFFYEATPLSCMRQINKNRNSSNNEFMEVLPCTKVQEWL